MNIKYRCKYGHTWVLTKHDKDTTCPMCGEKPEVTADELRAAALNHVCEVMK